MHGTGFIVDSDGWILTAFHVVADRQTRIPYPNIKVSIHGVKIPIDAKIISPLDEIPALRDFSVLKINKGGLQYLRIGDESEIEDGSPIYIVGFPISAIFPFTFSSIPRFCLGGTVAAQVALPIRNLEFLHTIYFQGVSIKGISGAPIISPKGDVVGIVTTKMTGITRDLETMRSSLVGMGGGSGIGFGGIPDIGVFVRQTVDILDNQLANGLGSGTGAGDAKRVLAECKKKYNAK